MKNRPLFYIRGVSKTPTFGNRFLPVEKVSLSLQRKILLKKLWTNKTADVTSFFSSYGSFSYRLYEEVYVSCKFSFDKEKCNAEIGIRIRHYCVQNLEPKRQTSVGQGSPDSSDIPFMHCLPALKARRSELSKLYYPILAA